MYMYIFSVLVNQGNVMRQDSVCKGFVCAAFDDLFGK